MRGRLQRLSQLQRDSDLQRGNDVQWPRQLQRFGRLLLQHGLHRVEL
jgi:hypothetical protein